jgi:IS5 family transposase
MPSRPKNPGTTLQRRPLLLGLISEIKHYGDLARKVYDQTFRRRSRRKRTADQKVFSIFEDHTDIIIKDRRDTHYGHKICLTGGASI